MREPAEQTCPLLKKMPELAALDGRVEIGVGKDDVRRLAAELQRHALEIAGGAAQDLAADRRASR